MPRPTPDAILSGMQSWDASVEANFNLIFETPLPLATYADFGSLPTASSYEGCIALIEDEDVLVVSDGAAWTRIGRQAAAQTNSTAVTVGDLVTDFNALLTKLRATKIIAT